MAESHGGGGGCCPPMDLMRSEPMQLVQLIVPMESAHLTVSYLGDLGLVQFKDVRIHYTLSDNLSRCLIVKFFDVHCNLYLLKHCLSIALEIFCKCSWCLWSSKMLIYVTFLFLYCLFWCWFQLNSEKSPFQRTYAAQVSSCLCECEMIIMLFNTFCL